MSDQPEQPTLTDGEVTLRPWRDEDVAEAVAGHDELIAHWFGWPADGVTTDRMQQAIRDWRATYADERWWSGFALEDGDGLAGSVDVRRRDRGRRGAVLGALPRTPRPRAGHARRPAAGRLRPHRDRPGRPRLLARRGRRWSQATRPPCASPRGPASAARANAASSPARATAPRRPSYVILARLASDPPLTDPQAFRALLNSFLPRKRAISQLLVRDREGRVLICQLTYKRDWDLPGGVVEVGESPRDAAGREIEEELALAIGAGDLLLTDWLPPWGGWDDAVCLVFDGGEHDAEILDPMTLQTREIRHAEFATPEQVRERCADFTARRIASALAVAGGDARPAYVESGGT